MDLLIAALLVLAGLAAGLASGLFGVGGGIVVVPALVLASGLSFRDSVAASLLYMVFTSPVGVWRHWRAGNVDFRKGATLALSGIVGVLGAEYVGRWLPDRALILGFCVILTWAAYRVSYGHAPRQGHAPRPVVPAIGVASGFVSKLFGVGGGIVVVPGLVVTGVDVHLAIGTSLVVVFANALLSSAVNLGRGHAWAVWSLPVGVGALLGTPLGSSQSVRSAGRTLRHLFALLMLVVALDLVRGAV